MGSLRSLQVPIRGFTDSQSRGSWLPAAASSQVASRGRHCAWVFWDFVLFHFVFSDNGSQRIKVWTSQPLSTSVSSSV